MNNGIKKVVNMKILQEIYYLMLVVEADMPTYFYPLMDINLTDKPLECLRLGALGVIAHMLKLPADTAVVRYLVNTSCLQHCTKAIEIGSTESKTIAVFIINKIMSTGEGLQYCCVLPDRFFFIDGLLKKLLVYLTAMGTPCPSLFNLLVGCYTNLSYKPRFFLLYTFLSF
ncbi:protein CAF40-like [Brassica rapa]|uniref:protein CAF40-like n=1 Tax=Brassica campestris TaxID=3711 RepID=UPI00142D6D78|nr:protein CAF40-like [Brassica rapa]